MTAFWDGPICGCWICDTPCAGEDLQPPNCSITHPVWEPIRRLFTGDSATNVCIPTGLRNPTPQRHGGGEAACVWLPARLMAWSGGSCPFFEAKVAVTQCRNTLLQVKGLHSKFYLSKSTKVLENILKAQSESTHYAEWPISESYILYISGL